jgi:hypothetical protein
MVPSISGEGGGGLYRVVLWSLTHVEDIIVAIGAVGHVHGPIEAQYPEHSVYEGACPACSNFFVPKYCNIVYCA